MDSDALSVPSSTLSLETNDEEQQESNIVGLHVLTAESMSGSDTIIGQLNEESGNSTMAIPALSSEITSSDIDKDGEITLQSSLIPENAVLMETPRGLMLTVPETMTYDDIAGSGDPSNRPLLSCIPVSFFKTCDVNGDGDTSMVYDDVSVDAETSYLQQDLNVESCVIAQVQKDGSDEDVSDISGQATDLDNLTTLQPSDSQQDKQVVETQELIVQEQPPKRKGGWPKGKKRKMEPVITGPRAPVTGYVLYAVERRKVIKENHPEISFTEVTKILGQEWSSMPSEEKEKYLAAAEKDKKRYKEELKAFRSSETYQETMRKKLLLQAGITSQNGMSAEALAVLEDDENSSELHCKVCNCYFSSAHNKKEHMYGKVHLQNVTDAVEKEFLRQQREEQGFIDGALVVSEETSHDEGTLSKKTVTERSRPVDIHGFMMEFIHKNYEREQEISILRRNLNKSLQDNLIMCKNIQELQDYQSKLQEELKSLTATTTSLIVQSDALKTVPTLFGIINL